MVKIAKILGEKNRQDFFRQIGENLALSVNCCCSLGVFQHKVMCRNSVILKKSERKAIQFDASLEKSQRVECEKSRTVLSKFRLRKFTHQIWKF